MYIDESLGSTNPISLDQQLQLSHYDEYTLGKGGRGPLNQPTRTFDNRSMMYKRLH